MGNVLLPKGRYAEEMACANKEVPSDGALC